MSRYIRKEMYPEKQKLLVIWDGWSSLLKQLFKAYMQFYTLLFILRVYNLQ
jgi:hypothetical protein